MNELYVIIENQMHYENLGKADGKINMAISEKSVPQEFRKCYWDGFMVGLLQRFHRPNRKATYVRIWTGISSDKAGKYFRVIAESETSRYLLDETGTFPPFWLDKKFSYKVLKSLY